jgi:hypothetical protein
MTFTFKPAVRERFNQQLRITPGCWLWLGRCFESGYGQFYAEGRHQRAHRVAWRMYEGDPGPLHVLHSCDTPCCVNPAHLFLGTHAENMADMASKGRAVNRPLRGDANPGAKLTAAQASAIKTDTRLQKVIAAEFGVHQVLVSRIKTGKAWAHL